MNSLKKLITFLMLINIIKSQEEILDFIKEIEIGTEDKTTKHYSLKTLGYITPWNKEGYSMVEEYANKFDFISPVWFELKPEELDGEFQMILEGGDNVDTKLMKNLRKKKSDIKILPRLHCGSFQGKVHNLWMSRGVDSFVKVLERRIKYNKFDGYVFDCIYLWTNENIYNGFAIKLLPKLRESMIKLNKKLIITLFAASEQEQQPLGIIDQKKFKYLANYADYLNVMTYDYVQYKGQLKRAFNAPYRWIKKTIDYYVDPSDPERDEILSKVLFGIPFHGYVFDKNSLVQKAIVKSSEFMKILKDKKNESNLKWDKEEKELLVETKGELICYPNREFIKDRLELSEELKLGGCGIWEIGNGNNYLLEPL